MLSPLHAHHHHHHHHHHPGQANNMRPISSSANFASTSISSHLLAPLQPQTRIGEMAFNIIHHHHHHHGDADDDDDDHHLDITEFAIRQLTILASQRDQHLHNASSNDEICLYKRISEIKQKKRRIAVEEIMYALLLNKIIDADANLLTEMPSSVQKNGHGFEKMGDMNEKLACMQPSSEMVDMAKQHALFVVCGKKTWCSLEPKALIQVRKLRMTQIYAASILYGYFLRRIFERYELETRIGWESKGDQHERKKAKKDWYPWQTSSKRPRHASTEMKEYLNGMEDKFVDLHSKVRTKETMNLIDRQTQALFGECELREVDKKVLRLYVHEVERLVYEALAFGRCLWEVETLADSYFSLSLST